VKYVSAIEQSTFVRQHSAPSDRETFYKRDSSDGEQIKTAEMMCCVSEAGEEEGHCTGVTRMAWDCIECFLDYHTQLNF
jgi:hypothetical protein